MLKGRQDRRTHTDSIVHTCRLCNKRLRTTELFGDQGCTRAVLCIVLIFSFYLPKQLKQSSETHFYAENACNSVTITAW